MLLDFQLLHYLHVCVLIVFGLMWNKKVITPC